MGLYCHLPTMDEAIAANLGLEAVPTQEEIDQAFKDAEAHTQATLEKHYNQGDPAKYVPEYKTKRGPNYTPPKKKRKR